MSKRAPYKPPSTQERVPYKPPCPQGCRLIELTQGQYAIVDECLYDRLTALTSRGKPQKWRACWNKPTRSYYALRDASVAERAKGYPSTIGMHAVICGTLTFSTVTDHLNHNTLDNRMQNLRPVTQRKNLRNLRDPGTSEYPNVCWIASRQKWTVALCAGDRTTVTMGRYKDEDEAGRVAKIAQDYVDANTDCTVQDLKDLRAQIRCG